MMGQASHSLSFLIDWEYAILLLFYFFSCTTVPNESPTITKSYLTSATSLRLFWTPVQEPITGYQVGYRSSNSGEWKSVLVTPQTLSIQLENLREGNIYRILVAAFNRSGNGIPSKGVEIRMKEGGELHFMLQ